MQTGYLKLLRHKENRRSRLLMRQDVVSSPAILNFPILGATPLQKRGESALQLVGRNFPGVAHSNYETAAGQDGTFLIKFQRPEDLDHLMAQVLECQHE